ncbi:hypothetical protein SAMN05192589_103191 [Paracidovorax valerianellae]|uniref:Uncharacterized protein n=1 Tax=Paracidovorax valerianellae TaxID=187868 RepID=A0A1G6PAN2_9BURK|nr:hypothetical protein SAMN05192589_103191 [Paracidovorax valerianellae]
MLFAIPATVLMSGLCGYFTFWAIPDLVNALRESAPVVRIWPVLMLAPAMLPLALLTLILLPMKGMQVGKRIVARSTRWINVLVVLNGVSLLLMASTSTLLQSHFLPPMGYEKCADLQGQPSLWFTDWVRDPAWCVKGKSLEWVNEQARTAAAHGTP